MSMQRRMMKVTTAATTPAECPTSPVTRMVKMGADSTKSAHVVSVHRCLTHPTSSQLSPRSTSSSAPSPPSVWFRRFILCSFGKISKPFLACSVAAAVAGSAGPALCCCCVCCLFAACCCCFCCCCLTALPDASACLCFECAPLLWRSMCGAARALGCCFLISLIVLFTRFCTSCSCSFTSSLFCAASAAACARSFCSFTFASLPFPTLFIFFATSSAAWILSAIASAIVASTTTFRPELCFSALMPLTRDSDPSCPYAGLVAASDPSTSSFSCSVGATESEPFTSSPPFSVCTASLAFLSPLALRPAAVSAWTSSMVLTRESEPASPKELLEAASDPSTSSSASFVLAAISEPVTSSPPCSACTTAFFVLCAVSCCAVSEDSAPCAMSSPFICASEPPALLLVSSFHELSCVGEAHAVSDGACSHPSSECTLCMKRLPPVFSLSRPKSWLSTPSVAASSLPVCISAPSAVFSSSPVAISEPPSSPN
mmetsp:Transcript_10906/g.25656  ORF Transcript_10906/g.25656 Transcript_10906/m.25656 type:complete len:487 (-) Transcript_10906:716-2176(-)